MPKGHIIKSLAGFYDVACEDGTIYTTRARGKFRKDRFKPLVGDVCEFTLDANNEGYIRRIMPRRNVLTRPPIANVDQALLVFSITRPDFDSLLLDRFLAQVESQGIHPVIAVTKVDLDDSLADEILKTYKDYDVILVSSPNGCGVEDVKARLKDKVTVVTGQSGVGKSTLLNALDIRLDIPTNDISEALGRGKHTTRHVELLAMHGGFVADTPGFSSLELEMTPTELSHAWHDFEELSASCKYRNCLHDKEPGCAVKQAVEGGGIAQSRYTHYISFLKETREQEEKKYG